MLAWIKAHPFEVQFAVMVAMSVVGAVLPKDSKAGILIRRLTTDWIGKNSKPK